MSNSIVRIFNVTIKSTLGGALLMHNPQLADPLSSWRKSMNEQSSKRKKSDSDYEEIARIEFQGGLYYDDKIGPYLPGPMLDAALVSGAKVTKLGKSVRACVRSFGEAFKLDYDGPRTREELWAARDKFSDRRQVKVGNVRVVRVRPRFENWSCSFQLAIFPGELNPSQVRRALDDAGVLCGIGDFRPRFGLFVVESFEEVSTTAPAKKKAA